MNLSILLKVRSKFLTDVCDSIQLHQVSYGTLFFRAHKLIGKFNHCSAPCIDHLGSIDFNNGCHVFIAWWINCNMQIIMYWVNWIKWELNGCIWHVMFDPIPHFPEEPRHLWAHSPGQLPCTHTYMCIIHFLVPLSATHTFALYIILLYQLSG